MVYTCVCGKVVSGKPNIITILALNCTNCGYCHIRETDSRRHPTIMIWPVNELSSLSLSDIILKNTNQQNGFVIHLVSKMNADTFGLFQNILFYCKTVLILLFEREKIAKTILW